MAKMSKHERFQRTVPEPAPSVQEDNKAQEWKEDQKQIAAGGPGKPDLENPEWVQSQAEAILKAAQQLGVRMVSQDEFDLEVKKRISKEEAQDAARTLGLDLDAMPTNGDSTVKDVTEVIDEVATAYEQIHHSRHWSTLSPKQKTILHAVRVFIRQLRGERAPAGQARTLQELLSPRIRMQVPALNTVGRGEDVIWAHQAKYNTPEDPLALATRTNAADKRLGLMET